MSEESITIHCESIVSGVSEEHQNKDNPLPDAEQNVHTPGPQSVGLSNSRPSEPHSKRLFTRSNVCVPWRLFVQVRPPRGYRVPVPVYLPVDDLHYGGAVPGKAGSELFNAVPQGGSRKEWATVRLIISYYIYLVWKSELGLHN